jgi:hypothetical protein
MGGRKYIADAVRQAIHEQRGRGWFKLKEVTGRISELADHGPLTVQRVAQHIRVYEIPVERREYRYNRFEYRCPHE